MIITNDNLKILFTAYKAAFQAGFGGVEPEWKKCATEISSSTSEEKYGWLQTLPGMREWLGERQIANLKERDYAIKNKAYEETVGVLKDRIEDDQYNTYANLMTMLGDDAARLPDKLIFGLLKNGFTTQCYDGQTFFNANHPLANGGFYSNVQTGAFPGWYLLDTSRPIKPLIFQVRKKPTFVRADAETDSDVFTRREFKYGVDMRCNVGFGFWQMAFGSTQALTPENFNLAFSSMGAAPNDAGDPLGVKPSLLVCGMSNRANALTAISAAFGANGASNINLNAVQLLVSPYLP